ncbi:MAG: MFS transporter [Desulfobacula sp.]|jgi:predicted MFS family arabinose efflux permease|uniref:MFS transporter n=1 Tax=Desulfobacula sp. TaxID=2593537 RepID=UPI001D8C4A1D|nr:MFS transporter [Desulfobacula sp.]MBT3485138.1 MFS transporter [Desulfobacula sp.]MBT4025342.1 MFS transporter [Desulfobacula sp.]MBT4199504.1 MFS transporter [Desulfobacula sp.]MBT4506355.1 MFS transporter [Desulfobacula sp.]
MPDYKKKQMYFYLIVLSVCSTAGLQCWQTLFDNFSVNVVGLDGHHIGALQSVREIPGFLALLVTYVILIIKEHKLSALSIIILGAGLFATGFLPSFSGLILTTMIMSFGFHYFETTNKSLTLQYFDKLSSPLVLSAQRSYAAGASVVVGIIIFLIAPILSYKTMYIIFGSIIIVCGLWAITKNPSKKDIIPQKKQLVLKKEYWLYYFLTFMAGARRQIFMAFAIFLLVKKFGFSVQDITLLFLLNNGINFFINPLIGKFIVKYGERKLLSMEYFFLILVFISYAYVDSRSLVAILYILDHMFFNFSTAINTYFQKIADPRDIASSAAVGFTINHIAAVILPVIGGLLWIVDYKIPFLVGAFFSLISLVFVQFIRTEKISA